jgi:nucleoid-associated protein YgaU
MRRFNKILILALLAAAATVAVLLLKPAEQPVSRQAGPDAGYLKAIAPPSALVPPPGPRGPAEPAAGTSEPSGALATGGAQAPRDRVATAELSPEPPIPTEQALDQASTPQQQEVAPGTPDAQGTEAPAAARLVPEVPLAIHRVGAGDTLSKLAKKYYGDSARWNLIQKANPGLPKVLQVGSEVVIPVAPQGDR